MDKYPRGKFLRFKLQEVVTWVKNAWDKITGKCVACVQQAGYMDKKGLFQEKAIAQHEGLGPMVL